MHKVDYVKIRTGVSYKRLCVAMRLSYPSFKRWRMRNAKEGTIINTPGPKKVMLFDTEVLKNDVANLEHCNKRSHGVGKLYAKYAMGISRRDIDVLVSEVRQELREERRASIAKVEWLVPNIAWSMDSTMYNNCEHNNNISRDREKNEKEEKYELLTVRDLGSKYYFNSMATQWTPCGDEVAGHLGHLFALQDNKPLFLKMDNGRNLNSGSVLDVLQENWVIPFVSPPYYPQYNGSQENAQGELKNEIRNIIPNYNNNNSIKSVSVFEMYANLAGQNLNHKPRGVLKCKIACRTYFDEKRVTYTIRQRREIYDWINEVSDSILVLLENKTPRAVATAKRRAIGKWLINNRFINININGKSVTQLF